ncbi:ABC-three component system middle component 1 [Microbulbifer sp. Q7]|uniref:ABC-three component system middle component 1 n=1 Tax=Microbulbifer sp. Q7 TaxID=1785091 RepID=UPI0008340D45|nr:ABC-three component system middle component 1 [Microbulbifer sp. Q7]
MNKHQISFKRKRIDFLSEQDLDTDFSAYEVEFYPDAKATCICCLNTDAQFIKESWRDVMDFAVNDYMVNNLSEFEAWNTYLVFLSHQELEKEVQYEIENDKFSMRKLFIQISERYAEDSRDAELISLLNKKLLLHDVDLGKGAAPASEPEKNISSISLDILKKGLAGERNKEIKNSWLESKIADRKNDEN